MFNLRCKKLLAALFFLLLFFPSGLLAAEESTADVAEDEAPGLENEGESVTFNFNDVDIRSVIKSVARITGKNFLVDPQVKAKVTIISSEPMSSEEIYAVFLSILQVHDLDAVEVGEVTKIIPYAQAKTDIIPSYIEQEAPLRPADQSITRVIKLQYVQAERLVGILKPLLSPKSYIAAHPETNVMIITDRAANIERLLKIVKRIDQATDGGVEAIRLEYASARDVVTILTSLLSKGQKKGAEDFQMVADERTNSVLMSGDEQYVLRARTIIAHLDAPVEAEGDTQVIFLRFSRAKDLAPVLSGMKLEDDKSKKEKAATTAVSLNIQADEGTNALIITAPPDIMKALRNVIAKLDVRRAQVLIEAVIAEISIDKTAEFGIQFRSTSALSGGKSGFVGGTNYSVGDGINTIAASPLGVGNGFSLGYFDGSTSVPGFPGTIVNLGGLIRLLESTGDTNILSTPSLMTMDNQEAEITVAKNVPFYTSRRINNDLTSSYDQTVERHDVGLKLKVKPQISEGDTIMLEIEQEASDLAGTSGSEGMWTTNTRSIKTRVTVEDGKLLILGGLIQDNVDEKNQKVPLLGDIPYLGALFRYSSSSHKKTNLLVFLRPVIMRDESISSQITMDKYDFMQRLQKDHPTTAIPTSNNLGTPMLPNAPAASGNQEKDAGQNAGSD